MPIQLEEMLGSWLPRCSILKNKKIFKMKKFFENYGNPEVLKAFMKVYNYFLFSLLTKPKNILIPKMK